MKILATALIAAASFAVAVAAAPSTASAAPTLACAAAAQIPAEITSSAHLASDSGEGTATTERLRGGLSEETSGSTADQQGRRDRQVPVVVARSCI
jgi:hypothetical protein